MRAVSKHSAGSVPEKEVAQTEGAITEESVITDLMGFTRVNGVEYATARVLVDYAEVRGSKKYPAAAAQVGEPTVR